MLLPIDRPRRRLRDGRYHRPAAHDGIYVSARYCSSLWWWQRARDISITRRGWVGPQPVHLPPESAGRRPPEP